jgi:hypothetical protein
MSNNSFVNFLSDSMHNKDGSISIIKTIPIVIIIIIVIIIVGYKYGTLKCPSCGLKKRCKCYNGKCGCRIKYGTCVCN